jgi:hypothetical protein
MTLAQSQNLQMSSTFNNKTSTKDTHSQPFVMSMFGALNRFISRLDAAPIDEQQSSVTGAYGFQILRNTNQDVPLEPWFDFIIGINGRTIVSSGTCISRGWGTDFARQDDPDPGLFATEVRNCAGQTISLGVFSGKVRPLCDLSQTSSSWDTTFPFIFTSVSGDMPGWHYRSDSLYDFIICRHYRLCAGY